MGCFLALFVRQEAVCGGQLRSRSRGAYSEDERAHAAPTKAEEFNISIMNMLFRRRGRLGIARCAARICAMFEKAAPAH
jgi:hypothetical protein